MKNIYIALTIVLVIVSVVTAGVWMHHSSNEENISELFIGNVQGVTAQDIKLCNDSYLHGGKYYHHIGNAALTCEYNHISVDFDEE